MLKFQGNTCIEILRRREKIEILSHFFRLFFREFYTRGHVEGPRKDERRIAPYNE